MSFDYRVEIFNNKMFVKIITSIIISVSCSDIFIGVIYYFIQISVASDDILHWNLFSFVN